MLKSCFPFLFKPSSYASILAPVVMDPIQSVKPKNSRTLMVDFNLNSGASHYIIRIQNSNGFFREDRVSSSPAEIQSLMPYTEYALSIMAVNIGGRSQPSAAVTAKTGMVVYLLSDKETLWARFLYPKWVMFSPGSSECLSNYSTWPA